MTRYISSLPQFHVRTGYVHRSPVRRGHPPEQKAVDVLLSVDALEHAAHRNMNVAKVLAGDLDSEPLMSALVRLGVHTELHYVQAHVAEELLLAVDEARAVTLHDFWEWTGRTFQENFRRLDLQVGVNLNMTGMTVTAAGSTEFASSSVITAITENDDGGNVTRSNAMYRCYSVTPNCA